MMCFTVTDERCTRCGLCVLDCPAQIIEQTGSAIPRIKDDGESSCIQCQHCLAVCPTAAVSIFGKNPADSITLSSDKLPGYDQMATLLRARRSIRRYKDCNVDPELLARLLATVSNAPSGVNSRKLTFRVVSSRDVMHKLRDRVLSGLRTASEAGKLPQAFTYLTKAVPAYYDRGTDIIFRNAPHVLVVSAPPDTPCPTEDIPIALTYFELLAQSAGLGTVWCGMLKMAIIAVPELREPFGLPRGHAFYPMLFGIPDIHFARTVQRDDAANVQEVR
jgi:nitroreductase/NAD-dependent dihydropyrimidine dehydrogenase PreA subunit